MKPRPHITMYRGLCASKPNGFRRATHVCHFLLQFYPYSLIQTILSALESHQIMHLCARAIPPVGNHTPPRVNIYLLLTHLYFSTNLFFCQLFLICFPVYACFILRIYSEYVPLDSCLYFYLRKHFSNLSVDDDIRIGITWG